MLQLWRVCSTFEISIISLFFLDDRGTNEEEDKDLIKLDIVLHIMMYAQASLLKGNNEEHICLLITSRFTEVLAGWWDDLFTESQKTAIKSATKYDHSQQDHMGNPKVLPDMVNTLIYTICLHFMGNLDVYQARVSELLINLKCPSLSHFRWYKNVFFSKVFQRKDSIQNEKAANRQPTVIELRAEMNSYKKELQELQRQQQSHNQQLQDYDQRIQACESLHSKVLSEARLAKYFAGFLDEVKDDQPSTSQLNEQLNEEEATPTLTIVVSKAFIFEGEALIDSSADLNCICEGIIPSRYFSKTTQMLNIANGGRMLIECKLSGVAVCNDRKEIHTEFCS
ncbi:hypothetical protein ACOSQ2_014466 [Xanthoceras sorbifolium]